MTAEQHSRPSEEEVLLAFSVELTHDRKTLEQYLREYPEHAHALVDCSIELMMDTTRSSATAMAYEEATDRAWQRFQSVVNLSDEIERLRQENKALRKRVEELEQGTLALIDAYEECEFDDVLSGVAPIEYFNELDLQLGKSMIGYAED